MNRFPRPASRRALAALAASLALAGCSWFYPGPSDEEREKVSSHVKPDMNMEDAIAELQALSFVCENRKGSFFDEMGRERQAGDFQMCTKRPGLISFYCTTRDQVVVVPRNGLVGEVYVVSGPACINNSRSSETTTSP